MTGSRLDGYRELGSERGLAAGLAAVLDGVDPATAAPQRVAVLPVVDLPRDARVLPSPLLARDRLALVRFPAPAAGAASGHGLSGWHAVALAAVRIGVLGRLLDAAMERLAGRTFGGVPLTDHQLVVGAVSDVVTEMELSAAALGDADAPADVATAQHERLTTAGWTVTRLFGAEGYLADHPARSLRVHARRGRLGAPAGGSRTRGVTVFELDARTVAAGAGIGRIEVSLSHQGGLVICVAAALPR